MDKHFLVNCLLMLVGLVLAVITKQWIAIPAIGGALHARWMWARYEKKYGSL